MRNRSVATYRISFNDFGGHMNKYIQVHKTANGHLIQAVVRTKRGRKYVASEVCTDPVGSAKWKQCIVRCCKPLGVIDQGRKGYSNDSTK